MTPILTWPGKRPPLPVTPLPAQLVETFGSATAITTASGTQAATPTANALYLADNFAMLTHLLASGYRGRVKLIYIDPPFDTGQEHQRKVRLRMPKAPTMQTSADTIVGAQTQYDDRWDADAYLQFIYDRLPLLRDLLAEDGSLWLHCDHRQVHHLRVLLQEVFGAENYLNTIIWRSQVARGAKVRAFYFPFSAHYIEIFAKNRRAPTTWNPPKKQLVFSEAEAARAYQRDRAGFFRTSDPGTYSFASLCALHAEGRLYAPHDGQIVIDEQTQRVYASNGGNIGVKYYLTPIGRNKWATERAVDNMWDDIPGLGTTPGEDLGYPTQKTAALLERVIRTATDPGDLVLDCFMGSGTTLAVAQQLGRYWIGCDNNHGALHTTRRRLHAQARQQPSDQAVDGVAFTVYHLLPQPMVTDDPLQARVRITRNHTDPVKIEVVIDHVASPALSRLLAQLSTAAAATADNWRTWVDCVAIDPCYDGRLLRVQVVDAPVKKSDQVTGYYTLLAPTRPTRVAVRISDLLGQETLCVAEV